MTVFTDPPALTLLTQQVFSHHTDCTFTQDLNTVLLYCAFPITDTHTAALSAL